MSTTLTDEDWELIFPEKNYTLGKTVLHVKPLELEQLSVVVSGFMVIREVLSQEDITIDTWRNPDHWPKLAIVIAQELPELLGAMSGLTPSDVAKLPITIALELATVCIEVNIKSGEGLVKNFKALGSKLNVLGSTIPMMMEVAEDSQ